MQKVKQWLIKLPIRTVLTILLFPFFLLLLFCCIFFYISGVTHYTDMVKENAESLVTQSRNYLNDDMSNIQAVTKSLLAERVFYTMDENNRTDQDSIEPTEYMQL